MKRGLDKFVEFWTYTTISIYCAGFLILLTQGINILPWWYFVIYLLAGIPSLCILYAFNRIIDRVVDLENEIFEFAEEKNLQPKKEIEDAENVEFCKNCGYQLFDDDKICPNCKQKRDIKNN